MFLTAVCSIAVIVNCFLVAKPKQLKQRGGVALAGLMYNPRRIVLSFYDDITRQVPVNYDA